MLVTRSSPATGLMFFMVEVTWPLAFTATSSMPVAPRSCLSYCASSPACPTRSSAENPVTGMCSCLTSWAVIGWRYPSTCAAAVEMGWAYWMTGWMLAVTPGKEPLFSRIWSATLSGTFCATGIG